MKILKRIRLINWHRFIDETINFNDSVLLSGENAAGKSTILDAIQLVLTCSKNYFNKAANDKGERNIISYVHCKTGKESRPFERTGYITGHVALEFYDEERKKSFILGTVTDTTSDTNEKTIWYRIDDCILEDSIFFNGRNPKKIDDFKKNKKAKTFTTKAEARRNYKLAYGNIEDKFFELIPKAMAFKPIDDIKDFVYSYVLDKKEVNIEVLKENVRTYQEFELILKNIKEKIRYLTKIEEDYNKVLALKTLHRKYEYHIKKILVLIEAKKIEDLENKIILGNNKLESFVVNEKEIRDEISNVGGQKKNLEIELFNNSEYIALNDISRDIEKEEREVKILKLKKQEFNKNIKKVSSQLISIIEKIERSEEVEYCLKVIEEFEDSLDEGLLKVSIERFDKYRKNLRENLTEEKFDLSNQHKKQEEQLLAVNKKIKDLENKRLQYDRKLLVLIEEIKKNFIKVERTVEPRILCELINITNDKWKNAVEGYLNTQRFYIVVSPEDFDLAQRIYTRVKKEKNIHSIGLVNTAKLEKYIDPKENTRASVVTSKSHLARSFANMILGKVSLCEDGDKIKEYKCAITPSCMLYQNHVLRAINPEIYNKPYIGEEAYKVQLIQAKEEKGVLKNKVDELNFKIEKCLENIKLLDNEALTTVKHTSMDIPNYKRSINRLDGLKKQKKEYRRK
ncbi:MAG: ATP-binding protein [Clostridium sp.]|nr:ATP-binding protein [Clostridium sp.]